MILFPNCVVLFCNTFVSGLDWTKALVCPFQLQLKKPEIRNLCQHVIGSLSLSLTLKQKIAIAIQSVLKSIKGYKKRFSTTSRDILLTQFFDYKLVTGNGLKLHKNAFKIVIATNRKPGSYQAWSDKLLSWYQPEETAEVGRP